MIEKFISIKNIGRFRDCSPKGDVTFRKLTLLFAENGRGKTTLCAILRSLETGQHEFISERKTLGATDAASVQMRLGGNTLNFSSNAWSGTHSGIAIFDSVFIHDNVYAGDYVDHDHKKNLYRVIVGAQGVQLAKQIDDLDTQIREANTDIRTKKDAASTALPSGVAIDAYLAWQPVTDVEAKIQQKSAELANRQRALEKATEIQSKGLLAKVQLPELPTDFLTILAKQLTDISADAETRVRQQIADHQMQHRGETWLSQGLEYVVNELCPFCGQGITANDLIAAYRSHFNTAYKELKEEVFELGQRVTGAIGDASLATVQQTLSSNLTLIEFWKQFAGIALPDISFDGVQTKYAALRDTALRLAGEKEQKPTETVVPGDDYHTAIDAAKALLEDIAAYNSAVDANNTTITGIKETSQGDRSVVVLKKELSDLEAKKKRFEPEIVEACKLYEAAVQAKAQLDTQKQNAKDRLDQHCERILQTYEQSINDFLDQFNTGFRIANTRHQYTGGTASTQFQIVINDTSVDLGGANTSAGTPCFKTTLSSGDRSALALAFFLAALKQDPQISDKIVVLDDPFTSLDRFRRTCTQQLIRKVAADARQVIVLSHDPHFLKLIWDAYPAAEVKVIQLCRTGNNTMIGEWDIEAETQSTYVKNYSTLLTFYRERTGTPVEVARAIRPFLEGMLRSHFPGHFLPTEWLGQFLEKIRNTGPTDGLQHAQTDLSELDAINEYSRKYHHDQNPNADSEPISSDELHGFVKRTLRLVGGA